MNAKYLPLLAIAIFINILMGCKDDGILSLNERSIIYCSEGSPDTFNPQLSISGTTIDATSKQLYNSLIAYGTNSSKLIPSLAKSWHVTRDGKKITLYLRQDVSFHQTSYFTPSRRLNADDVVFSFNRVLNKDHSFHHVSGGQYPFFYSVKFDQVVEKIEKINEYTVRFNLKHSDSSFMANLATDYAVILSEEYARQLEKTNSQHNIDILPIGTGPFKIKDYRVGSFIRFYRHDNYWQGKPQLEQLVYDISPSKTSRLTKLLAKECDVSSYPIAHSKISKRKDLALESITSLNIGYLGFNTNKAPFNNKLVRQAISMAINKQVLIDTVYQGEADQAKSIIPKTSWAYSNTTKEINYDPTQAKAMLKAAGYDQGFTMDIWAMPLQRAYNPNAVTMAKLIQADLKKIGVTVKIISYEWTAFLRRISQGEHQTYLLGWSAATPDPNHFFTPMLSCSASDRNSNHTFWCNQDYDQLLQQAVMTPNMSKRKQYYAQAMDIINDELPLLPIAHSKRFQARDIKVEGDILAAFGGISFFRTNKKNSSQSPERAHIKPLEPSHINKKVKN